MFCFCKHFRSKHTPPTATLLQDYTYCLRNIWIWPLVCGGHPAVSDTAFIKKYGLQTRCQLTGIICRCSVLQLERSVLDQQATSASKTAVLWLQSATTAILSPLPAPVMPSIFIYSLCLGAQCAEVSQWSMQSSHIGKSWMIHFNDRPYPCPAPDH